MSEMIEKVASALYRHGYRNRSNARWDQEAGDIKENYRGRARAAIEATREPTYVMIEALAVSIGSYPAAYSAYQGMIDAALSAPVVTGKPGHDA
jgi:hypothetical protein